MKLLKFAKVLEIKIFNFSRPIVVQLSCIFKFTLIIKTYFKIGRGVLLPGAPDPVCLIN